MIVSAKLKLCAVLVGLVLLTLGVRIAWISAQQNEANAAAVKDAAAKAALVDRQQDDAIKARDAVAAAKDAQLQAQSAQIKSLSQAVAVLAQKPVIVAGQPAPATAPAVQGTVIDTRNLSPSDQQQIAKDSGLPSAPSQILALTPNETVAMAKAKLACQIATNDLTTCRANLGSTQVKVVAANAEVLALDAQLKGGTKWQRLRSNAKKAACAAAGSAIGHYADQAHQVQGGALGAAAGVVACSLF